MTKQTKDRKMEEDLHGEFAQKMEWLRQYLDSPHSTYEGDGLTFVENLTEDVNKLLSQAHQRGVKEALERIKNKVRELGPDVVIPGLLDTYIDKRRVIKILDDSKLKLDKPFNKKEFVKQANEVSKILDEEKRTMTGAYDATTRAGKKRFRVEGTGRIVLC